MGARVEGGCQHHGGMDWIPDDLAVLVRTASVGVTAYVALVAMLRVSGKRTLSQMNAFDFVVTVAIGSTLATIVVSDETSLLQGVVAFGVLIGLQYVITWTSRRWRLVARLVKSEPTMLAYRGRLVPEALERERVLEVEVAAALREHGIRRIDEADLVVLETDGTISVVGAVDGSAGHDGRLRDGLPDQPNIERDRVRSADTRGFPGSEPT